MADEVADKEKLCMNQLIASKIDSLMVEEDFVVPDVKPDILNTISTNGTVCIEKKEILDGKIKIEGKIEMYIMYMADEEKAGVRSFHTTLDFVKTMELEKAKEDLCIMHPLPRVNEISVDVDDDNRACYFKQAKYGKFIRMALILKLLEVK